MRKVALQITLFFSFITFYCEAQQLTITGKVTDAATGDPVPFANVVFYNSTVGSTTDFVGKFSISTDKFPSDSLMVSYIGYKTKIKYIINKSQVINFQLEEDVVSLQEVLVLSGEDPAFEILRNVVKHKKNNDKNKLEGYEYETYTKIELDVDNISEKFKNRKIMQKITQVMDSVEQLAGEDGKPVLPVFISESISNYYYRKTPELKKEHILKTKVTGVGVEDGSFSSQYIGSSFQEYNFYDNWLDIVTKEFVSPIADGWKLYYEYDLTDSVYIDGHFCYRLDFNPKSEQDLAFTGTMWITKNEFALKQIDATVNKTANLNYIEKIKIQQELSPTESGAWIPSKNRVLLDIGEVTKKTAGMLAKFYTSNKNIVVNKPKDISFFDIPIEVSEDYKMDNNVAYWDNIRHEPLSTSELNVYSMIDTLVNIPVVKTYTEIIKIAVEGYYSVGKIDIGPYSSMYANNTVEGHRFQLGMRTNFNEKWIFGGRLAYGINDDKFKYRIFSDAILSRKKWTKIGLSYTEDIDQVGLTEADLLGNSVFLAASKFGTLVKPYNYQEARFLFERELFKGFTQRIVFKNRNFQPIDNHFDFAYYTNPEEVNSTIATNFNSTEIVVESSFTPGQLYLQSNNERLVISYGEWPAITARYTLGVKGALGSDFNYQKMALNVRKNFKMGFLGTSKLSISGEHIFSKLPYPLLKVHIGNQSNFYTTAAYNLMRFSEFVSDQYVTLKYNHHFEGFVLNRIPVMKKLKWRLLATGNVLYGSLSEQNKNIIPQFDLQGDLVEEPGFLNKTTPYVEVGYGVENIFKVGRIDFIHRLTYLDNPEASNFGIKISFQFIL
ncbi:MAG: DUF5686 and carboxypeptidase regulatory-like domain-containing protein [Cyclobacteriaceae bacterium]|nr:DUF5686 and carboxypeptidase regulatory-like domain-containing protein [Cyclobacteriaceae bacterium]